MRTGEVLLLVADSIAFYALAKPLTFIMRWVRHSAPAAVLIAVTQFLTEGPRWQMAPAYVLTGALLMIWLWRHLPPRGDRPVWRRTGGLVWGFGVATGVVMLIVSAALPVVLPVFRFPYPTGPYRIGTLTYDWTDTGRPELFSTDPHARRGLMVQIWYPAAGTASSRPAPYIPDADTVTAAVAGLHGLPSVALQQLAYVATHSSLSPPVALDRPSYPVLLYLEGLTGYRGMNTFQVEELASHGYVVVGIDQPGVAAAVVYPDGHRVVGLSKTQMDPLTQQSISPSWKAPTLNGRRVPGDVISYAAKDVTFTLDRLAAVNDHDSNGILTGRLDLARTGLLGVSFGAIVGAEACSEDARLKACLMEDAAMPADVVRSGLLQPSMWITRPAATMRLERQDAGGWTDEDIQQTQTSMQALYEGLPGDGYYVQIPGMFHIDLTDLDLVSPILSTVGYSGPIGARRAHEIIDAYSVAFFDKELDDRPAPLLDRTSAQYADVLFKTRTP